MSSVSAKEPDTELSHHRGEAGTETAERHQGLCGDERGVHPSKMNFLIGKNLFPRTFIKQRTFWIIQFHDNFL